MVTSVGGMECWDPLEELEAKDPFLPRNIMAFLLSEDLLFRFVPCGKFTWPSTFEIVDLYREREGKPGPTLRDVINSQDHLGGAIEAADAFQDYHGRDKLSDVEVAGLWGRSVYGFCKSSYRTPSLVTCV